MRKWFRDEVRDRFDALVIGATRDVTGRDVQRRLAGELRDARWNAVGMPKFDEVEVAGPGPLTDEERANVLAGLIRNGRR